MSGADERTTEAGETHLSLLSTVSSSGLPHLIHKIHQVAKITTVNMTCLKADDPSILYYFGLGAIYLALC